MVYIPSRTAEQLDYHAVNRVPGGYTIYHTGRSDDISNGTHGDGSPLKLDQTMQTVDYRHLYHFFAIGGRIIWEGASIDDCVQAVLTGPATPVVNQTGDYNKENIGGPYNKIVCAEAGQGSWDLNLGEKYPSTQILKATPIPNYDRLGEFDYNPSSNTLTRNEDGVGAFDLFDFDVSMYRFCNAIWGSKIDGCVMELECTELVGKLLLSNYAIRFTLTPVTDGVKAAIILTSATMRTL